jgi:UDP-N-acetylglucosamine diphosphorylase/glucosamine-1-phosphate N-acetyltransferase
MQEKTAIVLYESDDIIDSFYPLTLTRPICHLRLGVKTIGAKITDAIGAVPSRVLASPHLDMDEIVPPRAGGTAIWSSISFRSQERETTQIAEIGDKDHTGGILLLSSGFIPEKNPLTSDLPLDKGFLFHHGDGDLVGYYLPIHKGKLEREDLRNPTKEKLSTLTGQEFSRIELGGRRVTYPWDLMLANPDLLQEDLARFVSGGISEVEGEIHPAAVIMDEYGVIVSKGATVEAFALLDASSGPICIAPGVLVTSHSTIEGPAFIGEGTQVVGARIRGGCTIGEHCRIGGEVEQSILQGYVNKYHDGFLGHSYIGSWVNFGAGTTNSDLKNNYSSVRVTLRGTEIDTMQTKVGSFIADHVKTGIGTLMNTGFVCGAGSNIFGGKGVFSGSVPAFTWGDGVTMEEYRFDNFVETARVVMKRRGVDMSERYLGILQKVFEESSEERQRFLDLFAGGS